MKLLPTAVHLAAFSVPSGEHSGLLLLCYSHFVCCCCLLRLLLLLLLLTRAGAAAGSACLRAIAVCFLLAAAAAACLLLLQPLFCVCLLLLLQPAYADLAIFFNEARQEQQSSGIKSRRLHCHHSRGAQRHTVTLPDVPQYALFPPPSHPLLFLWHTSYHG